MRSVSRRRLADFVRPPLGEARISRIWSGIAASPRARPRAPARAWRWATATMLAAALAVAVLVGLGRRPSPTPALAGLVIDTGAGTQEVSLAEGSTLRLSAATRLRVISATAGELRLRLEHGSVVCDVVHRDERRFVVEAGGIEVEDRGTVFAVDVSPGAGGDAVVVRVERGAVEVHDASRAVVATLKPGQAWSTASAPAQRASSGPDGGELPSPAGSEDLPERALPPAPATSSPAPPGPGSARGKAPSPQALFERADAARLAGRHAEAAADFERFRRRFPGDPRAGLAAYELGRIRLGSLHDPRGAAEAFGAVLERPDDPFREGAEAGRVEALADLGDEEACKRARDAFRARYPRSPQTARVNKLCGR